MEEVDVDMEFNVFVYLGLKEEYVVKVSVFLCLYCVLMGIVGFKLIEEEVE